MAARQPICDRARDCLLLYKQISHSEYQPRGVTTYFPQSSIDKLFRTIKAEDIFTCPCERCSFFAVDADGRPTNRDLNFKVDDVTGKGAYKTTFALLIYTGYSGMLSLFIGGNVSMNYPHYLNRERFLNRIRKVTVFSNEKKKAIWTDLEDNQYRFELPKFKIHHQHITLQPQVILPIEGQETLVGKGDYGEVYSLEIPECYVDDELKDTRKVCDLQNSSHSLIFLRLTSTHGRSLINDGIETMRRRTGYQTCAPTKSRMSTSWRPSRLLNTAVSFSSCLSSPNVLSCEC